MHTTVTIKKMDSISNVEFSNGKDLYEFLAYSTMCPRAFSELGEALAALAKGEISYAMIEFDLESEGIMYVIFTTYPNYLVKMAAYVAIDWDELREVFQDQKMPIPVFQSMIGEIAYFSRIFREEIAKYKIEEFCDWDMSYFTDNNYL